MSREAKHVSGKILLPRIKNSRSPTHDGFVIIILDVIGAKICRKQNFAFVVGKIKACLRESLSG
jgi:hypothetical protein